MITKHSFKQPLEKKKTIASRLTWDKSNKTLPVLEKGRQILPASDAVMVDASLSDAQK